MDKFFIIGSQKSGTTWLRDCLDLYVPFVRPEWYYAEIFAKIEEHVETFGPFLSAEEREAAKNRICLSTWETLNAGVPGEKSAYPCLDGASRVNPDVHTKAVEIVRRRLPDARTVVIVRDPRAVFNSIIHYFEWMREGFSRELDPAAFARNWSEQNAAWIDSNPDSVVLYEDLKRDFRATLSRMLGEMGIPFTEESIVHAEGEVYDVAKLRDRQPEIYRTGTIDEWREKLGVSAVEAIRAGAGPLMERLGYEA